MCVLGGGGGGSKASGLFKFILLHKGYSIIINSICSDEVGHMYTLTLTAVYVPTTWILNFKSYSLVIIINMMEEA